MKTVFTNINEIAHKWAHQTQSEARNNGNFYFKGKDIFSYGSHFKIASIISKPGSLTPVVLFNVNKNSITTAKHKRIVSNAIPYHYKVFNVLNFFNEDNKASNATIHIRNMEYYENSINELVNLQAKAIKRNYYHEITELVTEFRNYVIEFKVKKHITKNQKVFLDLNVDFLKNIKKEAAKAKIILIEKTKVLKIKQQEILDLWLIGKKPLNALSSFSDKVYLRFNSKNNTVETSKVSSVCANSAKDLFKKLKIIVKTGILPKTMPKTIDNWRINSINLNGDIVVQCHKIVYAETIRFAKTQNW